MTFDIAPRTEQLLNITKEIDTIAIELQVSTQDVPKDSTETRLHGLSVRLRDLSAEVAAEIAADIGRQNGMRETLAASERQFRFLAENLPDNIVALGLSRQLSLHQPDS